MTNERDLHVNFKSLRGVAAVPAAIVLALGLAACGGDNGGGGSGDVSGEVKVDGSSTVFPLSNAAAEFYAEEAPDVSVTVAQSGTGGGFEAFCAGDTDMSNASRPIKDDEEVPVCEKNGVDYTELHVATDALTVVVNPDVPVDCITVEQLNKIWAPESEGKVTNWNQVDASFPDLPLNLFGPGTDSGTFDYFTDAINGEEGVSRADYEASEDDNVVVEGVANTEGGLGYFGFTYFEENADKLKALEVDSGDGCVAPSVETAQDGTYAPLSRPLFVYVSNASYAEKSQVAGYVDYYVENLEEIAVEAQFIPLNDEQYGETQSALDTLGSGA
jgi:phosphate transport system substrate-binding protein